MEVTCLLCQYRMQTFLGGKIFFSTIVKPERLPVAQLASKECFFATKFTLEKECLEVFLNQDLIRN